MGESQINSRYPTEPGQSEAVEVVSQNLQRMLMNGLRPSFMLLSSLLLMFLRKRKAITQIYDLPPLANDDKMARGQKCVIKGESLLRH